MWELGGEEGLGFYKTLIRMYPWDIMVIGPGNTSPTHTLEYLVRLRLSNSVPAFLGNMRCKYGKTPEESVAIKVMIRGRPWNF